MPLLKNQLEGIEYVIVGQGLAGSVMAMTLLQAGKKILVLNDENLPAASNVAAGLYNPVYGKELNLTWLADELFSYLHEFYSSVKNTIENECGRQLNFLHHDGIFRSFINLKQQNKFLSEADYFEKSGFVDSETDFERFKDLIVSDLDGFLVQKSGWLDTKLFTKIVRQYLILKKAYFLEKVNQELLETLLEENTIKKVIFCEGFHGRENRLFNWLPWNPAKGEILTIRILAEKSWGSEVVNAGIFIVPLGQNLYRVGATYAWHEFSSEPTEKAKTDLISKLTKLLKVPFEVVNQEAGVRPATKLRRPFVGLHPAYPKIAIFNGLGSKGVSLAPYFAKQLFDFFENNQEIHPEANIQQFYPLYFGSN